MSKVKISDVAILNKANIDFSKISYVNYLDTGSITQNHIEGFQRLLVNERLPSRAKRAVENGTIVYSSVRPRQKHYGILFDVPDNVVVSTGFITLDAKPGIDPYYLYNCITTPEKIEYIARIADTSVSSYPSINPDDLGNMEIDILDDYTAQCRVTSILQEIDKKTDINNKINAELESMAKAIYDYWFLQFEFPNEEDKPYKSSGGKMVWNEELKREIPEGWEVLPLSEIADYQNGHAFYKDGYDESGARIVDLGNVNLLGMYIDTKDDKFICIDRYDRDEYTKFRVVKNDLVMIMTDRKSTMDLLGKTGKIYKEERYLLNQRVARIRCKKEFNVNYLYATLNGSFVNDMLKGRALGSVQKYVNSGDIESLPILIPSNRVIKQFEEIVDDSYERMEEALRENEQLSSLRDFLLPLLMNGQVGFKD